MILHAIFLIILAVGSVRSNEDVPALTPLDSSVSSDNSTTRLPAVCSVCSCKADIVNCSNLKLESGFVDSQWNIKTMVTLTFMNNYLARVEPFPNLVINKLILSHNRIVKIDDCTFKEIRNLTDLDLSHNQLTSEKLKPNVFEGRFSDVAYEPLSRLVTLNLGHNALHTLNADLFEHIPDLKVLILEGNPLRVIDHSTTIAIADLPYLEELDLSYCGLKDLPDHLFHTPKYLTKLHLRGNAFTDPPTALEDAQALQYLCLDENPIQVITRENAFPLMPNLTELSLCGMQNLTKIGAGAFSGLISLQSLHIENSPLFRKIHEDALIDKRNEAAVWPPIRRLELGNNALMYLPAGLIARWDNLEVLDLSDNKWSCDCDNQYLIGSLLPGVGQKLKEYEIGSLTCAAPPEHEGKNLSSLANRHLRCLDLYEARPERDAAVLVGLLIGVLLAIPVTLTLFVFWQRGFFFCGSQRPATFSRAFYKRADNDENI
ncbi:leucine-rich repeat neuronal protein 1 [Cephus cinctus]|uniref:Leucine-rich repeat neuronal protein 1 n=1 Tax=Cephus cinctus TaxID=211228 RepID=A0AAJ7FFA1_CEPCN|nr:leucine-rich repeat neuronal protein 1 [Cephus cinctus]